MSFGPSRSKLNNRWVVGSSVFLLHTLFVLWGATTGIQASDSSEFVLAAAQNARIHPPGYPLLSLWVQLFFSIGDNVVWNTAVAMGVLHSMALALLVDALSVESKVEAEQASILPILMGALLASQPLWIRYSTIPEAFPALSLVFAGLYWLIRCGRLTQKYAVLFGLVLAFGLGTHHLFIFAAPMILLLMWRMKTYWYIWLGLSSLGLGAYGLLLFSNETGWSWGTAQNLHDVVGMFFRVDYGTFQITHRTQMATWWGTPLVYLNTLIRESYGIFLLGVLGAVQGLRQGTLSSKLEVGSTLVSWFCSSVVVLGLFALPTDSANLSHSNRFFVSSMVLWMPFVHRGVFAICIKMRRVYNQVVQLGFLGVVIALMITNAPVAGRLDTRMQRWLEHSCANFPAGSLVFVAGDGAVFGSLVGKEVYGVCSDVQFVYPRLLGYSWYRKRLGDQGIFGKNMVEILSQHRGSAFTVLGLLGDEGQATGLPASVPFGGYWMQFIPSNQDIPNPFAVEEHLASQATLIEQSIEHPLLRHQSAENWPLEQWGHSWLALGAAYQDIGELERASMCTEYGKQWLSDGLQ